MSNFNRIYRSILVEGRVPSIFRKATPEELAERAVRWGKIQLDEWMDKFMKRKDVRKNKDGSWDVHGGGVHFFGMKSMTRFPVRFGISMGDFYSHNTGLTTLEGAPRIAMDTFSCAGCPGLETLAGAPEIVGKDFSCSRCPGLTTLDGVPRTVGGDFYCYDCGREFTVDEVRKNCHVKGHIFADNELNFIGRIV